MVVRRCAREQTSLIQNGTKADKYGKGAQVIDYVQV